MRLRVVTLAIQFIVKLCFKFSNVFTYIEHKITPVLIDKMVYYYKT